MNSGMTAKEHGTRLVFFKQGTVDPNHPFLAIHWRVT